MNTWETKSDKKDNLRNSGCSMRSVLRTDGFTFAEPVRNSQRSRIGNLLNAFGIVIFYAICLGSLVAILFWPNNGWSAEQSGISEETALICIVGEAADQGKVGMLAVAEALRNRGTTKGVYGCQRKDFYLSEPEWVRQNAKSAWRESKKSNLVNGTRNWESTDFPRPYWAEVAEVTAHIGKHVFYSGVR